MIGVASVAWVVALGQAGAERTEAQLHALGDNLVWVEAGSRSVSGVRSGTHGMHNLMLDDAQAILSDVPEIRTMTPNVDGTVVVVGETRNWTTQWRGVSPDYFSIKRWTIAEGGSFSEEDVDRASNLVVLGETVRLQLFGKANPVGETVRVGGQPFLVAGLLAPKGQSATGADQDDTIVVPYTTAVKKLRGSGPLWLDDVLCSARRPEDIAPAVEKIQRLMRQRHRLTPEQDDDFNIRHPEEIIHAQMEAQRTLEAILDSIACVSLLVGGIGIMNVMFASVAERTREIGVRLAVGAPDWTIEAQFLIEAIMLTAFGGVAGVVVSILGGSLLARVLGWPVPIPAGAMIEAVSYAVVTGIVFGFIPARRAARLNPIAALRSD
jgi:putative ABC transport system permease protein